MGKVFLFLYIHLPPMLEHSIMAGTTMTTHTYPKRKRADISYHESSSDESEGDNEYQTSNEKFSMTARKVR